MSTGIQITGGHDNTVSWNLTVGMDTGISLKDSSNNILNGNIIITNETLKTFGQEFVSVAHAVQVSQDLEALKALAAIVREPHDEVSGWSTLVQKFGVRIGTFSIGMLNGILSAAAWDALKRVLRQHSIEI